MPKARDWAKKKQSPVSYTHLINKETITGDQFMEIFNRVKSGRENSDSDAEESAAVNEENDKEE